MKTHETAVFFRRLILIWIQSGIFLGLLSSIALAAADLESLELKSIISSRNSNELDAALDVNQEIRRLRSECDVQLEREKLPTSCFAVLEKEKSAGLIATVKIREHEQWLDRLCQRRLKSSRDRDEIRKLREQGWIPLGCRQSARVRDDDLQYSQETERPRTLFLDRMRPTVSEARSLQPDPLR